jgi:ABC-type glycerol-3-phosphate transport system permease component
VTAACGIAGYLGNTAIVGAVTVALAVPCAALAAYGFAQSSFRGRESLFYLYLGLLMVPTTLTLIPLFVEVKSLGMFDNWGALILPYAAAAQPLLVLLMRVFFEGISAEIFHAARIDGASELQIIRKVVVPLSRPILLTGTVIVAVSVWGDYLWPTIVLPDTAKLTISAGMQTFTGALGSLGSGAGVAFAAYVLTMLPLFALVAVTMKHFVAGVTAGSGTL